MSASLAPDGEASISPESSKQDRDSLCLQRAYGIAEKIVRLGMIHSQGRRGWQEVTSPYSEYNLKLSNRLFMEFSI